MENIILYWMRWSWKSIIWKNLSLKLKYEFYDLDKCIEDYVWEKINLYIEKNGWDKFREIENKVLIDVINLNIDKVVSLWWWTIIFENNRDFLLKKSTKLIYIESNLSDIYQRILLDEKNGNKRNALTEKWLFEELEYIFNARKSIYESFYDFKVLNNKSLEKSVLEIFLKIKK